MKRTKAHARAVLEIIERKRHTVARVQPAPSAVKQTDRISNAAEARRAIGPSSGSSAGATPRTSGSDTANVVADHEWHCSRRGAFARARLGCRGLPLASGRRPPRSLRLDRPCPVGPSGFSGVAPGLLPAVCVPTRTARRRTGRARTSAWQTPTTTVSPATASASRSCWRSGRPEARSGSARSGGRSISVPEAAKSEEPRQRLMRPQETRVARRALLSRACAAGSRPAAAGGRSDPGSPPRFRAAGSARTRSRPSRASRSTRRPRWRRTSGAGTG